MAIKKATTFSLKDRLFNKEKVLYIASLITNVYSDFDKYNFVNEVTLGFKDLELKERMSFIAETLNRYLPKDYKKSLNILLSSLPNNVEDEDFIFSSYTDFVARYGCLKEYLHISLDALGTLTAYFSAEFAIRPFLNNFETKTLKAVNKWAKSSITAQRRLASEGLRPRLPWAPKIALDYTKAFPILDVLHSDKDRYVTRSVANHLNDIAKISPSEAIAIAKQWKACKKQQPKELTYIISHGLRTLLKQGNTQALALLGYIQKPQVTLTNIHVPNTQITLGEYLHFSYTITATRKEAVLLDYVITYPTPHNKRVSTKVFQLKKCIIAKGESVHITKKHRFAPMTTKTLYAGTYKVELRVNGNVVESFSFSLKI